MVGPKIISKQYSGVPVHEIHIKGMPVMRRVSDQWINATQILRAAGLPKPQRTKILERDVTGGIHEKVQGGYAGFQGTWIPLESARELAKTFGIEQECDPLFTFVPSEDDVPIPKKRGSKASPSPVPNTPRAPSTSEEPVKETPKGKGKGSTSSAVVVPELAADIEKESDGQVETVEQTAKSPKKILSDRPMVDVPEQWDDSRSPLPEFEDEAHLPETVPMDTDRPADHEPPQRTGSYMSLRPATSRRRKYTYPGESDVDEEHESPPRKRRALNPVVTRTGSSQGPSQTSPTSAAPSSPVRDKTPPHAGKVCEGCGATSTPQWRRGPSGKRTLCNACGVKWTFGRLKPHRYEDGGIHSDHSSYGQWSDEDGAYDLHGNVPYTPEMYHERITRSSQHNLYDSKYALLANASPHVLQDEIQTLRKQLRESEMSRKRMREMLETAVEDDCEVDRSFRRAVAKCRGRGNVVPTGVVSTVDQSEYPHVYGGHYDVSPQDRDAYAYGETDDEDRWYELTAIGRFLNAVKARRGYRYGW